MTSKNDIDNNLFSHFDYENIRWWKFNFHQSYRLIYWYSSQMCLLIFKFCFNWKHFLEKFSRSISVPSDNIEGERKATAESTRFPAKVGPANRLPALRSVIICRSDIELAEEIPGREMTVSGRSGKQGDIKSIRVPIQILDGRRPPRMACRLWRCVSWSKMSRKSACKVTGYRELKRWRAGDRVSVKRMGDIAR